jgi:hypothetical protein
MIHAYANDCRAARVFACTCGHGARRPRQAGVAPLSCGVQRRQNPFPAGRKTSRHRWRTGVGAERCAAATRHTRVGTGRGHGHPPVHCQQPGAPAGRPGAGARPCAATRTAARCSCTCCPPASCILARAPAPFTGVLPAALEQLDAATLARLNHDLGQLIMPRCQAHTGADLRRPRRSRSRRSDSAAVLQART